MINPMLRIQTKAYETKDLAEAAALVVSNQKLIHIKREGSVCWFVFEDEEKSQELSRQYFFGKLLINAREYSEAMKRLKNLIFTSS